ncbi:hypothetical protein Trydic_g15212 [Trypoxylus dichotomus]
MPSYLINRQQYVVNLSCISTMFTPTSNVPQGFNMDPILFLLFIKDIAGTLRCQKLPCADDMKIFYKIDSLDDCLLLQEDLIHIESWSKLNH